MGAWQTIHDNFVTVLNSVNSAFHESDMIDLRHKSAIPASIFDHSYSLQIRDMTNTLQYSTGWADLQFNVLLQLCYEQSKTVNVKQYYNTALDEVANFIQARIAPSSFQTGANQLTNVTHTATNKFEFVGKADEETFSVIELEFLVLVRITVSN